MIPLPTRTEPTGQPQRRGIVVVGSSPLLDAVAEQLSPAPRRVEDVYEAVALVATSSAARAPGTVVLDSELLNAGGAAEAVRRAFAQVDPALRIIALLHPHTPANAARQLSSLFDACLTADANGRVAPQLLARAISSDDGSGPAPLDLQQSSEFEAPALHLAATDSQRDQSPDPRQWLNPQRDPQPAPAPDQPPPIAASTSLPFESTPAALAPVSANLGDTDLIEAVLSDPHGVARLAMQLLIQQSGWSDARRLPAPSQADPREAGVPIIFHDASFGHLVSAQASAEQLRPWADWLARWLALDRAHRDFRLLAYQDELTGAWNRRCFNRFLSDAIDRARAARRPVTVMVYDLDHFKIYNDTYGHDAGDEILRETVKLLNSVIRKGDRVFRIGGDEFAVVFADPEKPREPGSMHPDTVERIARRFQDQVCRMKFPKLGHEAPGRLSISAGLATYPWDGSDAESLLRHADQLALQSKQRGKNAITFGPGAQQMCGGK